VVVGSALVRLVEQMGDGPELPRALEERVRELVRPLRGERAARGDGAPS